MGGCRCAYKNCTLRTDGVTHMFHFPVFDKFRCHQWLTNAKKQEFLNLKVSQLKNRVVCQHHFTDDNFMNFRKDKLTFDAVPTEDGPYCDLSQFSKETNQQDESKLYSISLDEIEMDYFGNDKKANFSVKYGDFLTNCDMIDLDTFSLTNNQTRQTKVDKYGNDEKREVILNENIDRGNVGDINSIEVEILGMMEPKSDNIYSIQMNNKSNEADRMQLNQMLPIMNSASDMPQSKYHINSKSELNKSRASPRGKSKNSIVEEKKIRILNEQKINVPLPLPTKLEPLDPNSILPLPNKRENLNTNSTAYNTYKTSMNFVEPDPVNPNPDNILDQAISIGKEINDAMNPNNDNNIQSIDNLRQANSELTDTIVKPTSVHTPKPQKSVKNSNNIKKSNSLLKNRLPPEKKAAIEEKRKFNIKLRDIITSCLDKLDDQEDKGNSSKLKPQIDNNVTQKVSTYLAKQPELPSVPDYTVAYLEARMKKMENILLNKIDQNTQRIVELKQSLTPVPGKKAAHTQTTFSEELQKKHLYKEISKYLSPEANSLLYEELFINRHVQSIHQGSPTKKRKYRKK